MAQSDKWQPVYDARDVLELVKLKAADSNTYYTHAQSDTLDKYYTETIAEVAIHLSMLPLERETQKMKEQLDYDDMNEPIVELCNVLSRMFRKMPLEVGADVSQACKHDLVTDFRASRRQLLDGGLH